MHTLFKTFLACGVAAGVMGLAACSGGGSREEGYGAAVKSVTTAAYPKAQVQTGTAIAPAVVSFRRNDGLMIELPLALINLAPVELIACPSASAALGNVLHALNPLGTAWAHSEHEDSPPASPVNAAQGDGAVFDLGRIDAEPGSYCGMTVELQPGTASTPTPTIDGTDSSLDGFAVNVAPCYYPETVGQSDAEASAATTRECTQAKTVTTFRHFDLMFAAPVTIDDQHRTLDLTLISRYEEWFDGVDMGLLSGDIAAQARLVDNIIAATHALTAGEQNIAVGFAIEVGGEQALCGKTYQSIGNGAQQDYQLSDFRYYLSDVHLHGADGTAPLTLARRADGTVYQSSEHNVALLGLVQGCAGGAPISTLSLAGSAKAGNYDELCFNLGLPFELNHQDVATSPSPMNVTAMAWNWLGGHKFIRVDGVGDADGARQNFFLHLGSTGCSNGDTGGGAPPTQACSFPNVVEVCLDYAALQDGKRVITDVAPVFSESDIAFNTPESAFGCMSGNNDPECAAIVPKLGLDFTFNGQAIPSEGQQLFFVE